VSDARRTAAERWGLSRPKRPVAGPPSSRPAEVAAKAAVLRRLELDVTRKLDGLVSGDYLAFAHGTGTEPAGARAYGPGDDARRIDWCLTARALTAQVRTTEADRELETWVIADRSPSLDFGTAEREKREVVLGAVAGFGFLALRAGNRLGVIATGGDQLDRIAARSGRVALLAALSALYDTPRRETPPGPSADLHAALMRLERVQPRRGRIVVVSDFLEASDWAVPLGRLALRHQVVAVQVTDPREMELPDVGVLTVIDTETGRQLDVQTNSAVLRARYATAAQQRDLRIRSLIAETGAEHLHLSTDRDWLIDVARFVGRRRRARLPIRAEYSRSGARPLAGAAFPSATTPEGDR
jgi:uncharacterized protein (DUF58 family)